jgi:AmmeMemoRadiSam system protein B
MKKLDLRPLLLLIGVLAVASLFNLATNSTSKPLDNASAPIIRQSAFESKEYYEEIFSRVGPKSTSPAQIGGLFVNHHMLAPELIAESLLQAQDKKPSTVVLVSPNHFTLGFGRFISSEQDWQTPYGVLKANRELINKLQIEYEHFTVDESVFSQEHGVYEIVPFIKKIFPEAQFLPVVVKDQASESEIRTMVEKLNNVLPSDTLVVGSFDFSHYLTSNAADFNDTKSLAVIRNFDYDGISHLDIDSKTGIRLFLQLMEKRDFQQFNLVNHTNSSKFTNNFEFTETTSYITGAFTKGPKISDDALTLMYFGKWTQEGVSTFADWSKPNYPLAKVDRLFSGNDFMAGKYEGESRLLTRLGYHFLSSPQKKIATREIRGRKVTFGQVDSYEDIVELAKPEGIKVAATSDKTLVNGLAIVGVKIIFLESSQTPAITQVRESYVLSGFNRSEFSNQLALNDDVVVGVSFTGQTGKIWLFPSKFNGLMLLKTPSESANILNSIANRSDAKIRNQIKTGIINFE